MTAATLSRLPLSAGGALAGSLARGGLWTMAFLIDAGYWAAGRFMRAPVAISCVIAITGFSVLAGSNALFLQNGRHPAPLFFAPSKAQVASIKPATPMARPRQAAPAIDEETTGSVGIHPETAGAISHDDVIALQRKLAALKLFDGTADGLFGRRTAAAIKAFEIKAGDKPRGKLTRELLSAVLAAPIPAVEAPVEPRPTPVAAAAPKSESPVQQAAVSTPAGSPVPLAPIRRVQTIAVPASGLLGDAATPAKPAEAAAAVPEAAAAASDDLPPVAQSAAAAPATTPANVQSAQPAQVATQAAQPTLAGPAPQVAAQSTPPATPAVQPAATADAAVPAPGAALTATTDGAAMAMNRPADDTAKPAAVASVASSQQTPAQRLAAQMGTLPPEATAATATPAEDTSSDPGEGAGSTDPVLITKIQRGLASLGFLGAKIDGVPGEGTAKAIRNFEVFYDYRVTGLATPQLLNLLVQHGAVI